MLQILDQVVGVHSLRLRHSFLDEVGDAAPRVHAKHLAKQCRAIFWIRT